jgi:spore coat protein U-like protein
MARRLAAGGILWAGTLQAAHAVDDCRVNVRLLAFGEYVASDAAPLDATGSIRVQCRSNKTPGGAYRVEIAGGSSGNPANRFLLSGSNRLFYNLYVDAPRLRVWGDGTNGTEAVARLVTQHPQRDFLPVYGRVPTAQNAPPGAYQDTLLVTLIF